jgi:hypothetical protein
MTKFTDFITIHFKILIHKYNVIKNKHTSFIQITNSLDNFLFQPKLLETLKFEIELFPISSIHGDGEYTSTNNFKIFNGV